VLEMALSGHRHRHAATPCHERANIISIASISSPLPPIPHHPVFGNNRSQIISEVAQHKSHSNLPLRIPLSGLAFVSQTVDLCNVGTIRGEQGGQLQSVSL
jgi:hypothetical protein